MLNRNSDKSKLNQRDISPADRATNLFKIRNIFLGLRVGFQRFANGLVNKEFSLERNYVSEWNQLSILHLIYNKVRPS